MWVVSSKMFAGHPQRLTEWQVLLKGRRRWVILLTSALRIGYVNVLKRPVGWIMHELEVYLYCDCAKLWSGSWRWCEMNPPPLSLYLGGEGRRERTPLIFRVRAPLACAIKHSEHTAAHMRSRSCWSRMLPRGQKYTIGGLELLECTVGGLEWLHN